jgi:hypothetical protein
VGLVVVGYPGPSSVFVIVQVRCWPAAIVPLQSPLKEGSKNGPGAPCPSSKWNSSPGCSVKRTPFPTMMIASAIVVTAFLSSSTMPIQKVSAQMQPGMMMGNRNFTGMMGPGMMFTAPNVTGSVNLSPLIGNALSSQIKVGLSQATDAAQKAVGNNSRAVAAHLGVANGYLVYTVWLVDSSSNFHRAIVDVGNGKVLSSQQLPIQPGMGMMMNPGMMGMGPGMMMNPGMMGPGMMRGFHP